MHMAALSPLVAWQSFSTIIGSAAAALTGLMFVVITLIAGVERERMNRSSESVAAFGTPTVVHFCTALFVAVVFSAPWQALWHASLVIGLAGLAGVGYLCVILRRTLRQVDYEPVLEDWLWHIVLPFLSYIVLVVGAVLLPLDPVPVLFGIAAVTVLFLFIGIHNAWDTVTYITLENSQREKKRQDQ